MRVRLSYSPAVRLADKSGASKCIRINKLPGLFPAARRAVGVAHRRGTSVLINMLLPVFDSPMPTSVIQTLTSVFWSIRTPVAGRNSPFGPRV